VTVAAFENNEKWQEILEKGSTEAKLQVIREISNNPSKQGNEILLQLLAEDDDQLRKAAASELFILPSKLQKKVIRLFGHKKWKIRETAAQVILQCETPSISTMLEVLKSETEKDVTFWILKILGKIGDSRALPGFINKIQNGDREEKMAALQAISGIDSRKSIKILIMALTDDNWHVRKTAGKALIDMGNCVIPELAELLDTDNNDLFYWITKIFAKLKSPDAIFPLLQLLSDSEDQDKKEAVVKILGEIGDVMAVESLLNLLAHQSWTLRKYTAEALLSIGEPAFEQITRKANHSVADVRYWVLWILGKIGGEQVFPLLEKGCKDSEWFVRSCAATSLGELGRCRAVKTLLPLLIDENTEVRKVAQNSLFNLEMDEALPYLEKYLEIANDETADYAQEMMDRIQES
jgi:HEAT repeat protein